MVQIDTEEGENVAPIAGGEECQVDENQVAPKSKCHLLMLDFIVFENYCISF